MRAFPDSEDLIGDAVLQAFVEEVRAFASGPPPAVRSELAAVLSRGLGGAAGAPSGAPARSRGLLDRLQGRRARLALGASVLSLTVLGTGGAGALPGPAQAVFERGAGAVGIELPPEARREAPTGEPAPPPPGGGPEQPATDGPTTADEPAGPAAGAEPAEPAEPAEQQRPAGGAPRPVGGGGGSPPDGAGEERRPGPPGGAEAPGGDISRDAREGLPPPVPTSPPGRGRPDAVGVPGDGASEDDEDGDSGDAGPAPLDGRPGRTGEAPGGGGSRAATPAG